MRLPPTPCRVCFRPCVFNKFSHFWQKRHCVGTAPMKEDRRPKPLVDPWFTHGQRLAHLVKPSPPAVRALAFVVFRQRGGAQEAQHADWRLRLSRRSRGRRVMTVPFTPVTISSNAAGHLREAPRPRPRHHAQALGAARAAQPAPLACTVVGPTDRRRVGVGARSYG